MKLLKWLYEKKHKKPAPYYFDYSLWTIICKPFRKWITNTLAPNCPFNGLRIKLYRLAGFKIGKNCFIGMHSYLDDLCFQDLTFGNNVKCSYGVYFACHGRHQHHLPITIEDDVYIGMRASIISRNRDKTKEGVTIGKGAVIGACALVNCDVPEGATAVGIPCRIIEAQD